MPVSPYRTFEFAVYGTGVCEADPVLRILDFGHDADAAKAFSTAARRSRYGPQPVHGRKGEPQNRNDDALPVRSIAVLCLYRSTTAASC